MKRPKPQQTNCAVLAKKLSPISATPDAVSEVKGAASESASHLADEAGSAAKEVARPSNGQP